LRLKPKLEVILKESDFEVIDIEDIQNEGIYSYGAIEAIEFNKEKINWLVTILNSIFGLLTESGLGERYKDKAYLVVP
jgi:hypothetical protein